MIGNTILHYKILEKLGEGGMGVVYKAYDHKLKREVALKFLPRQITESDDERKRFEIEAQAAAGLNHPNIATVYNLEEMKDQIFLVLEYIEGFELRDKIDQGPLSIEKSIDIALQVADALQAAHEKGVVHRDIKSTNIMVASGRHELIKVMDFGLAKLGGQPKLTKEGTTIGTVAYMSPEQARGEEVDHRSDIFSLGVLLYEMLTGQLPFKGEYDQAVIYSVLNEDPSPLTGERTGIPAELERIVNKAMAKKADDRYQSLTDMMVDLRSLKKSMEIRESSPSHATQTTSAPGRRGPESAQRSRMTRISAWSIGVFALLVVIALAINKLVQPKTGDQIIDSIAVLPLENLSNDPEQEYFSDGMTEALIASLAQVGALKVISRTSVMRFKNTRKSLPEIAGDLDVRGIVEGSVLRDGDQVRITAQLIDAANDRHMWAKSYTRNLRDILALQNEVASAIANEIKVKLTDQQKQRLASSRQVDPRALQLYLKGRILWNKRSSQSLLEAQSLFEQALEIDPSYADAYLGIADCYALYGSYLFDMMPPLEALAKAKAAVKRVLELDPMMGEAYATLGLISFHLWDWDGADRAFEKAYELSPNYASAYQWHGHSLIPRDPSGLLVEQKFKKAAKLDPLSLVIESNNAVLPFIKKDLDAAVLSLERFLDRFASKSYSAILAFAYFHIGMNDKAKEIADTLSVAPDKSKYVSSICGYLYGKLGFIEEARREALGLQERAKTEYVPPSLMGAVYAGLGEKEKAISYLEKGVPLKDAYLPQMLLTGTFLTDSELLGDQRIQAIVKQIGIE